jgi:hypothetical protein
VRSPIGVNSWWASDGGTQVGERYATWARNCRVPCITISNAALSIDDGSLERIPYRMTTGSAALSAPRTPFA